MCLLFHAFSDSVFFPEFEVLPTFRVQEGLEFVRQTGDVEIERLLVFGGNSRALFQ